MPPKPDVDTHYVPMIRHWPPSEVRRTIDIQQTSADAVPALLEAPRVRFLEGRGCHDVAGLPTRLRFPVPLTASVKSVLHRPVADSD